MSLVMKMGNVMTATSNIIYNLDLTVIDPQEIYNLMPTDEHGDFEFELDRELDNIDSNGAEIMPLAEFKRRYPLVYKNLDKDDLKEFVLLY